MTGPAGHTQAKARRQVTPVGASFQFDGVAGPAVLPKDGTVLAALLNCLKGWEAQPLTAALSPPVLTIAHDRQMQGRWSYRAPALDGILDRLTATEAACAALADLSLAYCAGLPGGIGLHTGALEIEGRLVLLTGPRRAGKSTLVARLSAEPDVTVYCDDVLPVTADGYGIALGVAPRLRLPLPRGTSNDFRRFAREHRSESDWRYAYLRPPSLATHGRRAPLGALVVLRRAPAGTPARLHRLSRAAALQLLLSQSVHAPATAAEAFAAAHGITADLPAYTLCLSDLDDAAKLVRQVFNPATDVGPDLPEAPTRGRRLAAAWRAVQTVPGTALRPRDEGAFLWRAGDSVLWRLNPTAQGVWMILSDAGAAGAAPADVADVLAEAFPDADRPTLLADVRALVAQLGVYGFVRPVRS